MNEDREITTSSATIDAALLEILLETVPFGFAFLDRELRRVRVNPALAALDDLTVEALPGVSGDVAADLRRVLETGQPLVQREAEVAGRDWLISGYPVRDAGGQIAGVAVVVAEDTKRRRIKEERASALEALRSQRLFQHIADATPNILYLFDLVAGRAVYVNRGGERVLGYTPEQMMITGDELRALFHPDDAVRALASLGQMDALDEGKVQEHEFRVRHADGSWRWLHARNVVLSRTQDGRRAWHLLGLAEDVTKRKQAEEERERALKENARLLRMAQEVADRQRAFLREVLAGVTDGRLLLCGGPGDLPVPLPLCDEPVPLSSPESLGILRGRVGEAAIRLGFAPERWREFLMAVGEAAMNALIHGGADSGGAEAHIHGDMASGRLQVWIRDRGAGIALDHLHRATLERGYTTAGSLGNGFPIMIQTAERTFLLTGATGTTVVLEQSRVASDPAWLEERELLLPDDTPDPTPSAAPPQ